MAIIMHITIKIIYNNSLAVISKYRLCCTEQFYLIQNIFRLHYSVLYVTDSVINLKNLLSNFTYIVILTFYFGHFHVYNILMKECPNQSL